MHAGITPANAPAKIEDLNVQTARRDQAARSVRRSADRPEAGDARLHAAGNPAGRLRTRSASPTRIIAAAKADGKEPDRGKLNVPLLMEAQEILKIDSWLVDQSRRRAVVSRARDGAGRSGRRTVRRAAAEVRREAVRHRPHAAAEPIDHRPLRRPRRADRYRNADERLQRAARRRSRSTATS